MGVLPSPPPCSLLLLGIILLQAIAGSSAVVVGLTRRHHRAVHPGFAENQAPSCDLYSGSWVEDESYPLYQYSSCPLIDAEFNCQLYGRPDSSYLRYRWKPQDCDLPRFDGLDFLVKMRGKSVMFVGDSLGRNQWESLVCMLNVAAPRSPARFVRGDPLSTYNFLEYGVSISFYRAPYLVDIDVVQGKRVLRLDDISVNSNIWRGVDVLSFNSGHWWTHKGSMQGWDYMGEGGAYYTDMDRLVAFQKGLTTWANWVDHNIDRTKTKVFLQSISPTHYNPAEWNAPVSRNCYGETVPVSGRNYSGPYPDQMRVVRGVLRGMASPAYLLDITALSELRKDGHPSVYSGGLSPAERASPEHSSDCSHWCLPGLPDTWNQLFYTALLF
ncbi:protein PMR5 [Iris pallida]|uniref:Protein PMR5 n=1 Tax=Iris pallida TaxID=29817 RepID=A0AAX6I1E1_IRIPA|nr:protein PMR5 [Iris pallida]